jgi:hypothetical protein
VVYRNEQLVSLAVFKRSCPSTDSCTLDCFHRQRQKHPKHRGFYSGLVCGIRYYVCWLVTCDTNSTPGFAHMLSSQLAESWKA